VHFLPFLFDKHEAVNQETLKQREKTKHIYLKSQRHDIDP